MRQVGAGDTYDIPTHSKIVFRVYADSRPQVLQTAKLQKGIIIVCDGVELIEEGLGIGVPVCVYEDGTRFSLSADTYVDDTGNGLSVVKTFKINGIALRRFRGTVVKRGTYLDRFFRVLEKVYQHARRSGVVSLGLDLVSVLGVRNDYLESDSRGRITVTYTFTGTVVWINADITELVKEQLQSIVFTNELGGRWFSKYTDSDGTTLQGREIGAWQKVLAESATLKSPEFALEFSVYRPKGWMMVRGREVVRNRISWSGLDLVSVGRPKELHYRVEISGGSAND